MIGFIQSFNRFSHSTAQKFSLPISLDKGNIGSKKETGRDLITKFCMLTVCT